MEALFKTAVLVSGCKHRNNKNITDCLLDSGAHNTWGWPDYESFSYKRLLAVGLCYVYIIETRPIPDVHMCWKLSMGAW